MNVQGLRSRTWLGGGAPPAPQDSSPLPELRERSLDASPEMREAAPGGGLPQSRDPLRLSGQIPMRGVVDIAALPLAPELEARRRANYSMLAVFGLASGGFRALGPFDSALESIARRGRCSSASSCQ